jgi:hypothetical protein
MPIYTTMPCVLVNAIDAATETHLRTEQPALVCLCLSSYVLYGRAGNER